RWASRMLTRPRIYPGERGDERLTKTRTLSVDAMACSSRTRLRTRAAAPRKVMDSLDCVLPARDAPADPISALHDRGVSRVRRAQPDDAPCQSRILAGDAGVY